MVRIDRVVTRGGDGGKTSLGDGSRVGKDAPRIEALGAVDEANAAIGLLRCAVAGAPETDAMLARIQNDLFDVGADLCVPGPAGDRLRLTAVSIERLEAEIDALNAGLVPLTSFVLPGGNRSGRAGACGARRGSPGRTRRGPAGGGGIVELDPGALPQSAVRPFVRAGACLQRRWRRGRSVGAGRRLRVGPMALSPM